MEHVKRGSELRALVQNHLQSVDALNAAGSKTKTRLLSADQAFEMCLDVFQLLSSQQHEINIPPVIAHKTVVLFQNLNNYPIFPSAGKNITFPTFINE